MTATTALLDRGLNIAAARCVRRAVPDPDDRREILGALFGNGDAWRKRATNAARRTGARPRAKAKPAGRTGGSSGHMVDAAPSREHVRGLIDRKMRLQTIADAAGVSPAALGILLQGHYEPGRPPQETIRVETEARILAVKFEPPTWRSSALLKCAPSTSFDVVGYRVGRCTSCGELAPVNGDKLAAHPSRQGGEQ